MQLYQNQSFSPLRREFSFALSKKVTYFYLICRVTDFTIPAGIKWSSLYKECQEELFYQVNSSESQPTVWKNIERSIIKNRSSDIRRRSMQRRGGKEDEMISGTGKKEHVNCHDIKEIQNHLTMVCTNFPL